MKYILIFLIITGTSHNNLFAEIYESGSKGEKVEARENHAGEYFSEFIGGMAGSALGIGIVYAVAYGSCSKNPDPQCGTASLLAYPLIPVFTGAGVYGAGRNYHASGSYADTLLPGATGCFIGSMVSIPLILMVAESNKNDKSNKSMYYVYGILFGSFMAGSTLGAMYGYHDSMKKNDGGLSAGALLNIYHSHLAVSLPAVGYVQMKNKTRGEHVISIQLISIVW